MKAAGLSATQLAMSIFPEVNAASRQQNAPRQELAWSIEKVSPPPPPTTTTMTSPATAPSSTLAPVDEKLPTTQQVGGLGRMYAGAASTQPTTNPATMPTDPSILRAGNLDDEKVDVVVIVQSASAAVLSPPPATAPSDARNLADKPATMPATAPATLPSR
jgi:hypothetical protein